ncbi:MAG: aminotransferase class III, partial [Candidatus Sericytochromatia bacterium]
CLETATLGVIGAAGNIGRVYAEMMAETVPQLVLVGRETGPRLVRVAARIYEAAYERLLAGDRGGVAGAIAGTCAVAALEGERPVGEQLYAALAAELGEAAPLRVASDMAALRSCRLIVAASNSAKPLIFPEHLAAGPVVICDLSVPEDTAPEVASARPDVQVIKGGLVAIPHDPAYRVAGVPLPEGHAFACMSETLLLGLMGVREHFSYGPVEPAKVKQAMAWAGVNGFKLGALKTDRSY